jgi:glyoxylase-like metal-dependent hydrolase (beta-lactamase superfamily II)
MEVCDPTPKGTVMPEQRGRSVSRRQFLTSTSAGAVAFAAGVTTPARQGTETPQGIHKTADLDVQVVSDGHFFLPTSYLLMPDSPDAERQAVLQAVGPANNQFQLPNNVAVIKSRSDLILVDAGTGPRHQPTAGKLAQNLTAVGIQPADITMVVLTHAHPDHLWGVLDAADNPIYPKASYVISAREWEAWFDPGVTLPPALKERAASIISGATDHLAHIKDKVRRVKGGDDIASGVRVVETPGHTTGHISLELSGDGGLFISGDAVTHPIISFKYPSWNVPVDHEADRGVATRVRLLDRLATDKTRLIGAHLPFPGNGFVERKDGSYRFVPA